MGSKHRIAKYILPIMLSERTVDQYWVEPFVGGANIIDKVKGNRIGSDINSHLINALINIRDDLEYLPKTNLDFTEDEYKKVVRKTSTHPFKDYAGFAFSYGGKWLGGWRRDSKGLRDYVNEAYRNAVKQSINLQGVVLKNKNYLFLDIPKNSIVYCDPPYEGTTKYKDGFDHKIFWQWCRDKVEEGHKVFISEYNAPEDFMCIWQKEIVSSLTKNTGAKKGIEKLFIYGGT